MVKGEQEPYSELQLTRNAVLQLTCWCGGHTDLGGCDEKATAADGGSIAGAAAMGVVAEEGGPEPFIIPASSSMTLTTNKAQTGKGRPDRQQRWCMRRTLCRFQPQRLLGLVEDGGDVAQHG